MSKTRDYFAEMYVAGILADAGWNVYFPRRDKGFDFVITKHVGSRTIIRAVQVKGKYPGRTKTDKRTCFVRPEGVPARQTAGGRAGNPRLESILVQPPSTCGAFEVLLARPCFLQCLKRFLISQYKWCPGVR